MLFDDPLSQGVVFVSDNLCSINTLVFSTVFAGQNNFKTTTKNSHSYIFSF